MAAPSFLPGLLRIAARASSPRPALRVLPGLLRARAPVCPGTKAFQGVASRLTTPTAGLTVRLYERSTGRLVREAVSASDGSYSFPGVTDLRTYYVVLLDVQPGGYNAAIADAVVPE